MKGAWFQEIQAVLGLEMYQVLRLINSFLSFNIQSVVSSIIRLKELTSNEYVLPVTIANWPSYLQHGVRTQLALDLIEMGLIDRVAVLEIEKFLTETNYIHADYKTLKAFLLTNGTEIIDIVRPNIPTISYNNLRSFNKSLYNRNIL